MVDASYDIQRQITGIGIVVHQTNKPKRNGVVIEQILEAYSGVPASTAEKFAVLRALEIALERGYQIIKVRSDYNTMRRKLKKSYKALTIHSETDDLHSIILRLAKTFREVKFAYQPRRRNQNAHILAKRALKEKEPQKRPDIFKLGSSEKI